MLIKINNPKDVEDGGNEMYWRHAIDKEALILTLKIR
jgi:hypothetical protein